MNSVFCQETLLFPKFNPGLLNQVTKDTFNVVFGVTVDRLQDVVQNRRSSDVPRYVRECKRETEEEKQVHCR